MAKKQLWEPRVSSTELLVRREEQTFTQAADNTALTAVTDVQALSNATRTELIDEFGVQDLASLDDLLREQEWVLRDRLDYYSYDTRVENITVADGAWFTPIAVESVCAEDVGNLAADSIDEDTATFWRDSTNHQHTIVYELRSYPKKISKIRFFYGSGESARERLNNMDVHASSGIANIDQASKILETGINISWPTPGGVYVEHTLAKKSNRARYVKLVIDDTDNGNNQAQIREFQVWVETKDLGEEL